jgi:hypothetical protein
VELSRPCAARRWLSAHGHVVSFNLKKRQRLLQISTAFNKLASVSPPYCLTQTGVVVIDNDNGKVETSYICHYRASLQLDLFVFVVHSDFAEKSSPCVPQTIQGSLFRFIKIYKFNLLFALQYRLKGRE